MCCPPAPTPTREEGVAGNLLICHDNSSGPVLPQKRLDVPWVFHFWWLFPLISPLQRFAIFTHQQFKSLWFTASFFQEVNVFLVLHALCWTHLFSLLHSYVVRKRLSSGLLFFSRELGMGSSPLVGVLPRWASTFIFHSLTSFSMHPSRNIQVLTSYTFNYVTFLSSSILPVPWQPFVLSS